VATLSELLNRLDDDENKRGRQFEYMPVVSHTRPPLRTPAQEGLALGRVAWPGRWGADAGIDLVAKHQDGSLWAIQAKAYDPDLSVKKPDVDTFLSESARKQFSSLLLPVPLVEIRFGPAS